MVRLTKGGCLRYSQFAPRKQNHKMVLLGANCSVKPDTLRAPTRADAGVVKRGTLRAY